MSTTLAYWFFPLLTVAFWPFWPAFERARGHQLLLLTGLLAFVSLRKRTAIAWPRDLRPFLLLCAWVMARAVRLPGADEGLAALWPGVVRALQFCALALLVPLFAQAGERRDREDLLMGIALATLLTSAYGIAQTLGWLWPEGYTVAHENVSSFGNRNAAAEWTAVGALVALGLALGSSGPARTIGRLAFLAGLSYLWMNGSRGSLLAFAAGGAFLVHRHFASLFALAGLTPAMWVAPAALVLGLGTLVSGLGLWLRPVPPAAAPPASAPASRPGLAPVPPAVDVPAPGGDTGRVRLLVWQSTLGLTLEGRLRPLIGCGTGHFAQLYPTVRTPEEIALSSDGRRYLTRVETVHNDHLEILAETGLVGLALWIWFLWRLRRGARTASGGLDAAVPAVWIALVVNGCFRSPLFHAPVAAAAFAVLGLRQPTTADPPLVLGPRGTRIVRLAALLLACLAALPLLGECAAARAVKAEKEMLQGLVEPRVGLSHARAALDLAVALSPCEPDFHKLRADVALRSLDLEPAARAALVARARRDLASALHADPNSIAALRMLAYDHERPEATRYAIERLLRLDPQDAWTRRFAIEQAVRRRDTAAARELLRPLAARDPELHLTIAQLALANGDLEGARVHLADYTTARPDDPGGWDALAATFTDEKDARFRAQHMAESHLAAGIVALRRGDLDAAARASDARRAIVPTDARGALLDALIVNRRGDRVALARILRILVPSSPHKPEPADVERFGDLAPELRGIAGLSVLLPQ